MKTSLCDRLWAVAAVGPARRWLGGAVGTVRRGVCDV